MARPLDPIVFAGRPAPFLMSLRACEGPGRANWCAWAIIQRLLDALPPALEDETKKKAPAP